MTKHYLNKLSFLNKPMATVTAALWLILMSGILTTAQTEETTVDSVAALYRADAAYFYARLKELHPNLYGVTTRREWENAYQELNEGLDDAGFSEFVVSISSFAALAGDGHTNFLPFYVPTPGFEKRLPLRFYVFKDGVYVTATTPVANEALGGKVLSVNGHSIEEVLGRLSTLIGGDNPQWALRWAPTLLQIPLYFEGLGFGAGDAAGLQSFKLKSPGGESIELSLKAEDLSNAEWIYARSTVSGEKNFPHRFASDRAFDFVHWPGVDAVYTVYNEVKDEEDETVAQFSERLFRFIEAGQVGRLILDMRDNGGGNNYLSQPLLHGMIKSSVNRPGGLFILTGRKTFSAAMNLVTRAERHTQALFIGEPSAAAPNHYGDPVFEQLPNTGLTYITSTLYWQDAQPDDKRQWIYPDIPVQETFDDWLRGRDGAIEAALAYKRDPDSEITPPVSRWTRPSQEGVWSTMLDE